MVLTVFGVWQIAEASQVENSVSVSASSGSGGSSVIQSKTVINGKVVEDVTKTGTGAIEYHSTSYSDGSNTVVTDATTGMASTTASTTSTNERAQLQALVTQLRQYVALLIQLLAATAARPAA
jgi:predicted component of type VI protein secretion system